jgi:hypothetical protein
MRAPEWKSLTAKEIDRISAERESEFVAREQQNSIRLDSQPIR